MEIRFTPFVNLTLGLMALTVWLAVARFFTTRESSWPLGYYAALIVYWKAFEGALIGYWVLAGALCGLLIRFEFLPGPVMKAVRLAELAVFGYVLFRGAALILMW